MKLPHESYYLELKGYHCSQTINGEELWENPEDPSDFVIISARPKMPESVRLALIEELERMEREEDDHGQS